MLVIAKSSNGCCALHPSIPFALDLELLKACPSQLLTLARTFGLMNVDVAENRERYEEELTRAIG